MYMFSFESVLDLIKFYSDNDKLGTKLKYAPLKEYFLNKKRDVRIDEKVSFEKKIRFSRLK